MIEGTFRGLSVYLTEDTDPFRNLAREEALLDSFDPETMVLCLYRNRPCLVMGKHQNPWREIKIPVARERRIAVLRRVSGGGTVYHDPGNLNFSFMMSRDRLNRDSLLHLVASALTSAGFTPAVEGTFDIMLEGKKISGNAFCYRRDRALHHGTLLYDADLDAMRGLLYGEQDRIHTHAVASRPARTTNIGTHRFSSIDELSRRIVDTVIASLGRLPVRYLREADLPEAKIAENESRNRSWDWVYGRTPVFSFEFPAMGGAAATIRNGRISAVADEGGLLSPSFKAGIVEVPLQREALLGLERETGWSNSSDRAALEALLRIV